MWQIKYQNEFLDIAPDQTPEISRNSPLFIMDDLAKEVSTPITFAYSDKNSRLLGHYFFDLTVKTRKRIDVELYDGGSFKTNCTLVLESAGMNRAHESKSSASGYLLINISDFFARIKDKKLSQLFLGGQRTFYFTSFHPADGSDGYWQHLQGTWAFNDDY